MGWSDTVDIAIALDEAHPDADIVNLRYTDLHRWICALPGFAGDPAASNEKVLEAIQMAWFDERGIDY